MFLTLAQAHGHEFLWPKSLGVVDDLKSRIDSLAQYEDDGGATIRSFKKIFDGWDWTGREFWSKLLLEVHRHRFSDLFRFKDFDQEQFFEGTKSFAKVAGHNIEIIVIRF